MENNIEKFKNLKKRKVYTYKQLCIELNEDVLRDTSKYSQIKEWEKYIKLRNKRDGSFEILEIYENPIEKIDNRKGGNNSVYSPLIQLLLLDYISKNMEIDENGIPYLTLSKTKMYLMLGMCNQTYVKEFIQKYRQDEEHIDMIKKFKDENKLSEHDMNSFYERSSLKFNEAINSALGSLNRKSVLKIDNTFLIKKIDYTIQYNAIIKEEVSKKIEDNTITKSEFDNYMKMFKNSFNTTSTKEESINIMEAQRKTLNKLGLKDLFFAYKPYNIDSFIFELNKILFMEYDICSCFRTKTFYFTEYTLQSGIMLAEKEIEEIKSKRKELNNLLKDSIDNKTISVYNKSKDNLIEKLLSNENIFTYKENYVEAQRIISGLFMEIEE